MRLRIVEGQPPVLESDDSSFSTDLFTIAFSAYIRNALGIAQWVTEDGRQSTGPVTSVEKSAASPRQTVPSVARITAVVGHKPGEEEPDGE